MNTPSRFAYACEAATKAWCYHPRLTKQIAQLSLWQLRRSRALLQKQRRHYSVQTSEEFLSELPPLNASSLSIVKTTTPKALSPPEELKFGHTFTGNPCCQSYIHGLLIIRIDHMLSVEWTASSGWLAPRITPYQNLSLDPATCVFHYGFECFEGMKAYRAADGSVRLFRPDMNMTRFNRSAARIALPTFDSIQLIELVKKLVRLKERFIPQYARLVLRF